MTAQPQELLKEQYSALEESRADLVALYFVADPHLVDARPGRRPTSSRPIVRAEYEAYARNALVQLRRVREGTQLEEDHMRNRQAIVHWLMAQHERDRDPARDGKTYYVVADAAAFRDGVGRLLAEVQRIKSEGDYAAARALFETYGVHFDAALRDEVVARVDRLKLPSYTGFVMPRLEPVHGADGAITDVRESPIPAISTAQMLEVLANLAGTVPVTSLRRRSLALLSSLGLAALVPAGSSAQPGVSAQGQAAALENVLIGEDTRNADLDSRGDGGRSTAACRHSCARAAGAARADPLGGAGPGRWRRHSGRGGLGVGSARAHARIRGTGAGAAHRAGQAGWRRRAVGSLGRAGGRSRALAVRDAGRSGARGGRAGRTAAGARVVCRTGDRGRYRRGPWPRSAGPRQPQGGVMQTRTWDRLRWPATAQRQQADPRSAWIRRLAMAALVTANEATPSIIERALGDRDVEVRRLAALAAGAEGAVADRERLLQRALKDGSAQVG